MSLMMLLTVAVVRVLSLFVNQEEYTAKLAALPSMDDKQRGSDLEGWEYRRVPATNGDYVHRYYYHPCERPDAPVLLLVHGLNLDGRTFLHVKGLAEHWQLMAYDLPERCPLYHGSYDDWRAIVDDFAGQIDGPIAGVAGVSFGGGIALHLAANHPRFQSQGLVLISTTMINAAASQRANTHRIASWVRDLPDYKIYWFIETMVARNEKSLAREALPGRDVRDVLEMKHPDFFRQVAVSLDDYRAAEDAVKVRCPVLMLIGDRDDLYSREQEALMRQYIPQIEYEVVPGGTHSMTYLRGEEIAGRVLAFCRRTCMFTRVE